MQCHHYDAGRCRSCTLLDLAYPAQVTGKQEHCAELLAPLAPDLTWLPTVESAESGFRNKAKMVVTGTTDAPVLGILAEGGGVDLTDCPLYPPALQASFPALAAFVTRARLVPYDVRTRRGELKYVLVTLSPDGDLMARFVLRSTESVPRVRKHLPALLDALPSLRVVSVNLHPEHKAVVEGETEIVLTEAETLRMHVNGIDLHLRPQSFFQTNTDVAAALYRQSAYAGNRYAQYLLGRCYENGVGVFVDEREAMRWYQKAAENDFPLAEEAMQRLEKKQNDAKRI